MGPPRVIIVDSAEFPLRAAHCIAAALGSAVEQRGNCMLALAGGDTPLPVYDRLAALPGVPWDRITIYFTDERAVPPQHPDSNYRRATDSLLSRVAVPPERIHRMEAERPDRERAALDYEALLPAALDLVLLGMGSDGHTASLFPHSAALAETRRRVVPVSGASTLPRLTVTPPVLRSAKQLMLLVAGEAKALLVARALEGPEDVAVLPAQLALSGIWLLDRAAASRLVRTGAGSSVHPSDS